MHWALKYTKLASQRGHKLKIIILIFLFLSLISCEEETSISAPTEEVTPTRNYQTGICGASVISDHEIVTLQCYGLENKEQLDNCVNQLSIFIERYPDIFCENPNVPEGQGESFITESDLIRLKEDFIDSRQYYVE